MMLTVAAYAASYPGTRLSYVHAFEICEFIAWHFGIFPDPKHAIARMGDAQAAADRGGEMREEAHSRRRIPRAGPATHAHDSRIIEPDHRNKANASVRSRRERSRIRKTTPWLFVRLWSSRWARWSAEDARLYPPGTSGLNVQSLIKVAGIASLVFCAAIMPGCCDARETPDSYDYEIGLTRPNPWPAIEGGSGVSRPIPFHNRIPVQRIDRHEGSHAPQ